MSRNVVVVVARGWAPFPGSVVYPRAADYAASAIGNTIANYKKQHSDVDHTLVCSHSYREMESPKLAYRREIAEGIFLLRCIHKHRMRKKIPA
jgi:hypothetical protein